jgi:hypothetical protein
MLSMVAIGGWLATTWSSKLVRFGVGVGALLLLLAWFYAWAAGNGRQQCELRVERLKLEELLRQREVVREAVKGAERRAEEAELSEAEARKAVQAAIDAARKAEAAGQVCLGKDVTDALRNIK